MCEEGARMGISWGEKERKEEMQIQVGRGKEGELKRIPRRKKESKRKADERWARCGIGEGL